MLRAVELSENYNGQTALDSLKLNIEAGEVFCLLGADGAGPRDQRRRTTHDKVESRLRCKNLLGGTAR